MRFIMIARVLYDKGYEQYVEAARSIHIKYPHIQFVLLGSIDLEYPNAVPEHIVRKDDEEGHIKYLGYQKDVRRFIASSDCIVLPSYYNEGLSRVLMEGLAMSKPIITTNIPGCRETVNDGINGYLCLPKDSKSLIDSISKFINLSQEERIEMGKRGRKLAEEIFDIDKVIEIYDTIIGNLKQ